MIFCRLVLSMLKYVRENLPREAKVDWQNTQSCLSVCPSVCPSVCLSVCSDYNFEPLHIGTSFLVWRYILTISRSVLSIKVIGSRSRSCAKKWFFTYFNLLFLCMYLQAIGKVKVTYQGQGHTSRSRSNQGQHQIEVIFVVRLVTQDHWVWLRLWLR